MPRLQLCDTPSLGERGGEVHLVRQEVNISWEDDEIVVGEPLPPGHELRPRDTVLRYIASPCNSQLGTGTSYYSSCPQHLFCTGNPVL